MTRSTLVAIGRSLEGLYHGTVERPLPPRFLDLLKRLEEVERKRLPIAA